MREHGGISVALPRKASDARSAFDRGGRTGRIVQHPAVESQLARSDDSAESHASHDLPSHVGVLERRLRDEARLEGVHLAAREMAHLLNNDLAVAVGFVDLLQEQVDIPPHLADLLKGAANSLD